MDNESEVIQQEMGDTRAALTDKLETLEEQVVDKAKDAAAAVADTVNTVKEVVRDTVTAARDSVHETVGAIKDAFDLPQHVREHPWTAVTGAAALGFLGYRLLASTGSYRNPVAVSSARNRLSQTCGTGLEQNGGHRNAFQDLENNTPQAAKVDQDGVLSHLTDRFAAEIAKVKGLAIGALLGVARDLIAQSAPAHVSSGLAEVMDSITVKLGGEPIHGKIIGDTANS